MSTLLIAWDIETCPFDLDTYTPSQNDRYGQELRYRRDRREDEPEEASSRAVRSLHPCLGWICCISAVSGTLSDGPNEPQSWVAAEPEEEAQILEQFWEAIAGFPDNVVWCTFNGKKFDVPFLELRSLHRGLSPSRSDILNTYPYNHRPHADLCLEWPQFYSLDDLCDLFGLESPKDELDGSEVAQAVEDGRLDEVATYAKGDALATFRCTQAAWPFLNA
jgi:hypothetical protein